METLEKIKELTELLSVDATKFYKGNFTAQPRGGYVLFKGFGNKRIPLNPSDFIVTP